MKRILIVIGAILGVIIVAFGAVAYSAFGGRKELVDGADLPGGAKVVKDGFVASFMLPAGDRQVALIDAGNDVSGKAVLAELQRRGLGPEAVKAIFLTHGHGDHLRGVPPVHRRRGHGDAGRRRARRREEVQGDTPVE
jgi:glyoxylase-like metal-dependent hydrolase (beta-lactamase superfamily II)